MKKKNYTKHEEEELFIARESLVEYQRTTSQMPLSDNDMNNSSQPPCQYTIEELQADAAQFTEEFKSGQAKFISHEEIKRKYLN